MDDFDDGTPQGWSGRNAGLPPLTTTCGPWRLLGGYEKCGANCVLSKTYNLTGIPHTRVRVVVYWVRIDHWAQYGTFGRDYWELRLDGQSVSGGAEVTPAFSLNTNTTSICGWDTGGLVSDGGPFVTSGSIAHTGNTVLVEVVSRLNGGSHTESLGIDAVEVWVY